MVIILYYARLRLAQATQKIIFISCQILFQAIELHLFSLHVQSLILQVLGQGQSERNLEIGLRVFVRRSGSEALRESLAKN